jgi:hypothetical protein
MSERHCTRLENVNIKKCESRLNLALFEAPTSPP